MAKSIRISKAFSRLFKKKTRHNTRKIQGILIIITIIISVCALPAYSQHKNSNYYSSSSYSWYMFPYPLVSKDFTWEQRQLIWTSLARARVMITNERVRSCIQKYTTFGYRGKAPQDGAGSFAKLASSHPKLRPGQGRNNGGLQYLYINKFDENNSTLGRAPVGIKVYEKDLEIALNSRNLSKFSSDQLWAGVIIHEILHNWDYTHPEVQNGNFSRIPGNFVYEVGWCVSRDGLNKEPGSLSLTDGDVSPDGGGSLVD